MWFKSSAHGVIKNKYLHSRKARILLLKRKGCVFKTTASRTKTLIDLYQTRTVLLVLFLHPAQYFLTYFASTYWAYLFGKCSELDPEFLWVFLDWSEYFGTIRTGLFTVRLMNLHLLLPSRWQEWHEEKWGWRIVEIFPLHLHLGISQQSSRGKIAPRFHQR